jgi:hypothetical protein
MIVGGTTVYNNRAAGATSSFLYNRQIFKADIQFRETKYKE